MGVGGYVSVPPLWNEHEGFGLGAAKVILPEEPRWADDPRLLISVFLRDATGILRAVVAAMNQDVVVDKLVARPGFPEGKVRLTLDGLLSSTVDDVFVIVIIVRAIGPDGSTIEGIVGEDLRGPVTTIVERALRDFTEHGDLTTGEEGSERSSPVMSFPFAAANDSIFKDRVFSEYRFSVPGRAPVGARELGRMATQVSRVLRDAAVPIAYLFFPDRWTRGATTQTLRIGFGAPRKSIDMFDVDVRVTALARVAGCEFLKYDPYLDGQSMAERFGTIVNPSRRSEEAGQGGQGEEFDAVFVGAPAQPGLVAGMLEAVGEGLAGGTMAVLRGHTVACWLVPVGSGLAVRDKLLRIDAEAVAAKRMRVVCSAATGHAESTVAGGRTLWIAWMSHDRPGVLSAILEVVNQYVVSDLGGQAHCVDIKYAVSRVLADGSSCAGKMNLLLKAELLDGVDKPFATVLAGLEARIGEGCGGDASSGERFTVAEQEPGEEPWSSLVVESNT